MTHAALGAGNINSPSSNARQHRELAVNASSAHPNIARDDMPPQKRTTQTDIQEAVATVRLAALSQPTFAKILPNIRPHVVKLSAEVPKA